MSVPLHPGRRWSTIELRCILGCALGLAVSVAPAFLAPFGVLARPMSDDLGWSRGALFAAVTIFSGGGVLLTPMSGLLLDRIGPRPVALAGALMLPCAVAMFGIVPSRYAAFIGLAVLLAVFSAASNPAIYLSVIVRRFDRRLGLAIALVMAGLGFGQGLLGLLAQRLFEVVGWRGAWFGIAAIVAGLGLIAFAIVPWSRLPTAGRADPASPDAPVDPAQPVTWPVLLRSALFWTLSVTLLLVLMVASGVSLNLTAALRDRGFGGMAAASVASAIPLAAILGRLLTGALVDRLSYVVVGAALFLGQGIGCLLLVSTDSLPPAYLAVLLIGLGYGAESDLLPYVIKRRLGVTFFGSIFGLMFGLIQIGVMIGPLLAAHVFDSVGSYRPAFAGFGCASLVATMLWVLARRLAAPVMTGRD